LQARQAVGATELGRNVKEIDKSVLQTSKFILLGVGSASQILPKHYEVTASSLIFKFQSVNAFIDPNVSVISMESVVKAFLCSQPTTF
jgi:hypothetical protein